MLSYQIREYYKFALNELEKFELSISVLFEYERKYQEISSNTLIKILALSTRNSTSTTGCYNYTVADGGSLIEHFNKCNVALIAEFNLLQAFGDFSTYKNNVTIYKSSNDITDSDADNLIEQINILFESYQDSIRCQNDKAKAIIFMQKLLTFKKYFYAAKNFYINALNMFNSNISEDEAQQNCSIMEIQLLKAEFSFEEFTSHLSSIQKIYSELSQVICEDNAISSLKIVKIESGSLLATILGHEAVIGVIALLLTKAITLCFAKYTKSREILTNSEMKKQILDDLHLRDELAKRGFDVKVADENISKAMEITTKETLKLASAAPKFKINSKILEYDDFNNQKYLEDAKVKLLAEKFEISSESDNAENSEDKENAE